MNYTDKLISTKQDYLHTVRINWKSKQDIIWWNETCAMVLETFGQPGHKFIYHPFEDYMEFLFKTEKDAILCKLLLSDRI